MRKDIPIPFFSRSPVPGGLRCRACILQEGWDGKTCFVHVRGASDGAGRMLLTGQQMDVRGSDFFQSIEASTSTDGGRTWTGFQPVRSLAPVESAAERAAYCDMTPLFHKGTGRFLVTGHTALYDPGALTPIAERERYHRILPYAVFDWEKGTFGSVREVVMPDKAKFRDCGSGCSQCFEEEDGSILIPISFRELENGRAQDAKAAVMRCSFDGETLRVLEIGNDLEVPSEVRGIGECSVVRYRGRYYLTVRGDTHGYVCTGTDGLHFTQPEVWKYTDGEIVPTYNTQSHWLVCADGLYLVYTRKNGQNDHVFRHRAPLYVAQVEPDAPALRRETEFAAIPERGARLGNFGVFRDGEARAVITVSEWMQPEGCEAYGSDNALWFGEVTESEAAKERQREQ